MMRLFRSHKPERMLMKGYVAAREARRDISFYLVEPYNWKRPHQYNQGWPPTVAEEKLDLATADRLLGGASGDPGGLLSHGRDLDRNYVRRLM